MGNLIINLDSLASGRLDSIEIDICLSITFNLDPLASGRLDLRQSLVASLDKIFRSTSLREARRRMDIGSTNIGII